MACKEIREYWESHNGQMDLEWLEEHVETCEECRAILRIIVNVIQATLKAISDMLENNLTY
jgi:DNA-binding FrmR family transcriptional regulator